MRRKGQFGKTHGLYGTPAYRSWYAMIQRTTNENHKQFSYYGGRGIGVCDSWRMFANFHADMGARPNGMTLDRIDNTKGYEPGNCRWADRYKQRVNQRRTKLWTYNGKTMCLTDWIREITGGKHMKLRIKAAGEHS